MLGCICVPGIVLYIACFIYLNDKSDIGDIDKRTNYEILGL